MITTLRADYPINGLVGAVIISAMRDAARGDLEALTWLITDGLIWLDGIGFYMRAADWLRWLDEGKPVPPNNPYRNKSCE